MENDSSIKFKFADKFKYKGIDNQYLNSGISKITVDYTKLIDFLSKRGELDYKDALFQSDSFIQDVVIRPRTVRKTILHEAIVNNKEKILGLKVLLNTKPGKVDFSRPLPQKFGVYPSEAAHVIKFSINIPYADISSPSQPEDFAMRIDCLDFETWDYVWSTMHKNPQDYEEKIFNHYRKALLKYKWSDILGKIYRVTPDWVIARIPNEEKFENIKALSKNSINSFGKLNEEWLVLRLIRSFYGLPSYYSTVDDIAEFDYITNVNFLLRKCVEERVNNKTVFQQLYDKINDFGGEDNFTDFIRTFYVMWLESKYTSVENENDDLLPAPIFLDYRNNKILGFYRDGKDLSFVGDQVHLTKQIESPRLPGQEDTADGWETVILNKLHIYQAVQVDQNNLQGELQLPSDIIPAFFLKAFDDKNFWDNLAKAGSLVLDVVTTLSGAGNLLKLRHLTKITGAYRYFRYAVGGIEIASGTVSFALSLINECDEEGSFCSDLREYLFYLELATLSTDAITLKYLKNSANKTLKNMANSTIKKYPRIYKMLQDVANDVTYKIFRFLAKRFKKRIIINATNGKEIVCFTYRSGVVPVDKILMYARGRVRSVDNLEALEKELEYLNYQRQHFRKKFDADPRNEKRIVQLNKDIKNANNSINNRRALDQIGIFDTEVGNQQLFDFVLGIVNTNKNKMKQGEWLTIKLTGPKGSATTMSQWQDLGDGTWYLKTIKIFK